MANDDELEHRMWMETLLNSIPCGVFVVELGTGHVLYANAMIMVSV